MKLFSQVGQTKITKESLRSWNGWLAAIYAAQGVLILILSATKTFPVTVSYLANDPLLSKGAGHSVLVGASHQIFSLNLAYVVAAFLFIAALGRLLSATAWRPEYEADLSRGTSKIRWTERALSTGIMMVSLGLVAGVSDLTLLIGLFGLAVVMNLLKMAMEIYNRGRRQVNWLNYWVSGLAGIISWVILAIYLIGAGIYGSSTPAYVYWAVITTFVLFGGYAVNMWLQFKKTTNWKNYLYAELVYLALGLITATALAWQIFAGALR